MLRDALPASRSARRILVGSLFSSIGNGLVLPFLLIYLTRVRGLDAGSVGLLVGWMGLVALTLAPLGGSLVDRFGARRVVLPLFLVEAAGTAALAFVTGAPTAFFALTAIAIAGAALWSGMTTILASLTTEAERQKAFGLNFTLVNLGIGMGGLISGAVVDVSRPVTFQAIYLGNAASFLVPAAILFSLPHAGQRLTSVPGAAALASHESGPRGGYGQVLRDRPFMRFFLYGLALTTCGYAQIEVGFTAFSTQVAQVTPRVIGWALAGNTLLIVAAQLFVLRWLDGRSRTRALAVVGVIFATSWLTLAAAGFAGQRGAVAFAVAGVVGCAVVFAAGETLLSPVMPALTNALATDELRGRYNALSSMVWGISGVIGPVAAGPLIGAGHPALWVLLVVGGCLAASVLAIGLHGRLTPEQDGRRPAADRAVVALDSTREAAGARS
jgi:MFS family permease